MVLEPDEECSEEVLRLRVSMLVPGATSPNLLNRVRPLCP